jgi:hypothetical protein
MEGGWRPEWRIASTSRGGQRGLPDGGIDLETPEGHKAAKTNPLRWRGSRGRDGVTEGRMAAVSTRHCSQSGLLLTEQGAALSSVDGEKAQLVRGWRGSEMGNGGGRHVGFREKTVGR